MTRQSGARHVSALSLALLVLGACAPAGAHSVALARRITTAQAAPPAPTADPSLCGRWSAASGATGQPVTAKYGEISNCERAGDAWVIATEGLAGKPGVIGVDACHSDAACLDGQTNRDLSAWRFYPAPFAGGVRLLGIAAPGVLIVDDGGHQMRFTTATGAYAS